MKLNNEKKSLKLNSEKKSLKLDSEKKSLKFHSERKRLKLKNMKKLELKHEREMKALEPSARKIAHEESIATKFDLGKIVRLVPPFNVSEVDKYFQHFEWLKI